MALVSKVAVEILSVDVERKAREKTSSTVGRELSDVIDLLDGLLRLTLGSSSVQICRTGAD